MESALQASHWSANDAKGKLYPHPSIESPNNFAVSRQASREPPAGYITNDLWSAGGGGGGGVAASQRKPEIPSRDLKPTPPEINRSNKPMLGDFQEFNSNAKLKSQGEGYLRNSVFI